ncbi:MAG: hypothetical protein R2788_02310 [Saprospiraceae bacterium]
MASASDNCGGAVTPVSVSPSIFDCQSFPNNTVTLTVEDACGNPDACTANVYVAPFITNVIGVHTNGETCAGRRDGTILPPLPLVADRSCTPLTVSASRRLVLSTTWHLGSTDSNHQSFWCASYLCGDACIRYPAFRWAHLGLLC